ncbi:defective in cullin neddylation 1 domain containing SCCRO3 [Lycorma delicatula]|uniref:defective in cullin neddylation 1 domain containing SCCRO3 n=1 Tax=Lycorma delicatula TaxID=130591 RepID=UPI003F514D44
MGNCFSHGKGRPPPSAAASNSSTVHKDKDEISWGTAKGDNNDVASNGNTEPVPHELPSRATVYTHRVTRTNSETKPSKSILENKVNALFEIYCDPTEDVILADGIERLCTDLCLSPDEFRVLVLAWKFDAEQMCRFTRSEFINGCRNMHVDTLKGIQNKLPEIVEEVAQDSEKFKDLYRFTFRFGLDSGQGQRILPSDMAVLLWRLVFSKREPPILSRWLRFLECHPHVRGIPRDTWNMFLNFADAVGDDLSTYDDAEAWPSIFDDFVEFENDQANQNITTKEKDNIIKVEPH